ncbi:MAG TPA: hypothetical protein VGD71_44740, partial [Kribbella sp.]
NHPSHAARVSSTSSQVPAGRPGAVSRPNGRRVDADQGGPTPARERAVPQAIVNGDRSPAT